MQIFGIFTLGQRLRKINFSLSGRIYECGKMLLTITHLCDLICKENRLHRIYEVKTERKEKFYINGAGIF